VEQEGDPIEALPPATRAVFRGTTGTIIALIASLPEGIQHSQHVERLCTEIAGFIIIETPEAAMEDARVMAFEAIRRAVEQRILFLQQQNLNMRNG
jgi:pyruvate/2-oxoglutarate/acetoin dehydrogenase E1 component